MFSYILSIMFNWMFSVMNLPSLPLTTPILDPFLSNLLQMALIEGIPTNCLVVPGHRTRIGRMEERTEQVGEARSLMRKQTRGFYLCLLITNFA